MVAAVALFNHVLTVFIFRNQSETAAEIPATRTLAKISAERGHVANLRASGFVHRVRQSGVGLQDACIVGDLGQCGEGADSSLAWAAADPAKFLDLLDVD